jgi:predicted GNAT superfamily acetyltransferase
MAQVVDAGAHVAVTVRDVRGADELRAAQELQRRAWGITEDGYVLPVATMAGAQKVGGLVLGAFDAESRLIGFAFAFLGRLGPRLILYSQLTGVHPAHQSTGVGRALKFEQRHRAREMGLDAVVWAFDPLQASNAAFNLGVLGASCATYEVDMYGARSDVLNAGLATDRLLAEWLTAGEPSPRTQAWADTVDIVETKHLEGTRVRVVERIAAIPQDAAHLAIEVPPNISAVKVSGPATAAMDWQTAMRQAFQAAFGAGYVAVGFDRAEPERPRYLLERSAT